jgi:hypothetical protein
MCERQEGWKKVLALAAGLAVAAVLSALGGAQMALAHGAPDVEIWSDRGMGGVYRIGDCADLHFRAGDDCYVIVYEIDPDGYLPFRNGLRVSSLGSDKNALQASHGG